MTSTRDSDKAATQAHPTPDEAPTADELRAMTPEEVMLAGTEADGVHIVHRRDRFPIRGTKAEKRAERAVALCFLVAALAGVAFIVAFIVLQDAPHAFDIFRRITPVAFRVEVAEEEFVL